MRMVFMGPPGVGKGTQAKRVVAYLDIPHLSTGDMLRRAYEDRSDVGLLAQEYMNEGKLVPDELILDLVSQRLDQADCQGGFLLDGFPRTLVQAEQLDAFLLRRRAPLAVVLELTADADEVVRRMLARGRADDQPGIVRTRLEEHMRRTAPLSDYYRREGLLRMIAGTGTPDEVFSRIKAVVDEIRPKQPQ
jgi:adenylate kinase